MKCEILKFQETVKQANNILIVTHTSPDGDALGSCVALKVLLEKMNVKSTPTLSEPLSNKFEFFREYFNVSPIITQEYDLVIYVDCAKPDRTEVKFPLPKCTCIIDHHISNGKEGDVNIIDSSSPATGEIIFEIFEELKIPLDDLSAMAIYTAIICDTGCFMYSSTRKRTHIIAAQLYNYEFDRCKIVNKVIQEKTMAYSKLYCAIINNTQMFLNGKIAIGIIDFETYQNVEATSDDTDGLSNLLKNISGVSCGILLSEREKGIIKGSIRTDENYDANIMASIFNGGGHKRAAGFKTEMEFSQIKEKINEWLLANK